MGARIIDGAGLARTIRGEIAQRVARLGTRGKVPGLAVILVGEDSASAVYVRNKVKDCEESGIRSVLIRLPASTPESALLEQIHALNADPSIDGILVQLPLPEQIDARRVIESISPDKDVDGFHVASAGALMTGQPGFLPCTPYGVMKLLEHIACDLRGAEAVVIGRSNIVGKPQAMLLLQKDATVTICHSRTRDLAEHVRRADVVVAAAGRARMIDGSMIKPGAVVVDVGMNRDSAGRLCGDVDFEGACRRASFITPGGCYIAPATPGSLIEFAQCQAASAR